MRAPLFACLLPIAALGQGPVAGIYGATAGAGAAVAADRLAFGSTPAALRPGSLGFQAHVHRPFGMAELAVMEAGAFRDGARWGAAAGWREVAVRDLYAEDAFEARASRRWSREAFPGTLDAGTSWTWTRTRLAGRRAASRFSHAWGLAWRPVPRLKIGLMGQGLPAGPSLAEGRGSGWESEGATWQAGLEASASGQSLRFDLRKTGPASWRALASLAFRPHPSLEAAAGLAASPFQASLGLRASWAGFSLHQAARSHRWLGPTWLSSLAWSSAPGD